MFMQCVDVTADMAHEVAARLRCGTAARRWLGGAARRRHGGGNMSEAPHPAIHPVPPRPFPAPAATPVQGARRGVRGGAL